MLIEFFLNLLQLKKQEPVFLGELVASGLQLSDLRLAGSCQGLSLIQCCALLVNSLLQLSNLRPASSCQGLSLIQCCALLVNSLPGLRQSQLGALALLPQAIGALGLLPRLLGLPGQLGQQVRVLQPRLVLLGFRDGDRRAVEIGGAFELPI